LPPESETRSRQGFTLIEVLVAVTMLAIGVLGLGQVFVAANRHAGFAREETVAVALTQEIREKILSETFDDIAAIFDDVDTRFPGSIPDPALPWAEHLVTNLGAAAYGLIFVDQQADDPQVPDGMVRVSVTVFWQEGGREVSLPMQFSIAKTGP